MTQGTHTKAGPLAAGFALALMLGHPVLADDTEIYTAASNASVVKPNVLFILDTSTSMNNIVSGTGLSRLDNMKVALDQILQDIDNVNVGLMRFHRYGGPVLWPVSDIDASAAAVESTKDRIVRVSVGQSADDAHEFVGSGNVDLDDTTVDMGDSLGSARLTGFRFASVNIPQGAVVTDARLIFASHTDVGDQGLATDYSVFAEASDDAPSFSTANADLSARGRTVEAVNWLPGTWDSVTGTQSSDNLAVVVQEVVNRELWCGGNAMTLFVEGTGSRLARTFDYGDGSDAPVLEITYDATSIPADGGCAIRSVFSSISAGNDDVEQRVSNGSMYLTSSDLEIVTDGSTQQVIGLRFTNVDIPNGTDVIDARITFTGESESANYNGTVNVTIRGEASGNAAAFNDTAYNVTSRSDTGSSVSWSVPTLSNNQTISSPNLENIVEEIVGGGSWSAGNAMVFTMEGSGRRNVRSANSGPGPVLQISYRGQEQALDPTSTAEGTVRDRMREIVAGLTPISGTPIVDTLYEAALYYRGDPVDYGATRGDGSSSFRYTRVSHPSSYTGGTVFTPSGCPENNPTDSDCAGEAIQGSPVYESPMEYSCQTNYIVLLTDGQPSRLDADDKIRDLLTAEDPDFTACISQPDAQAICGVDLVEFLHDFDQNGDVPGNQTLNTYTIGFNLNDSNAVQFNRDMADAGGGRFYEAQSAADLVGVFENILSEVSANSTTFNAPAISVNAFNRTSHNSEIYFSLFKPASGPHWDGNLKRYELGYIGEGEARELQILDATGAAAVDETGFFSADSKSFWTTGLPDGPEVTEGGARQQLVGDRTVYVNLAGGLEALDETDNGQITELSGFWPNLDNAEIVEHIGWLRGTNPDGSVRKVMGDPLHSKPVAVTYGGSEESQDTTLFIGTNDGYLHAFDADTGQEQFSIIPDMLLGQTPELRVNAGSEKFYGLDGRPAVHKTDDGDVYLYIGMRRGGEAYYAFNVTDRTAPTLMWRITDSSTGFGKLGQSWSTPVVSHILDGSTERTVLFIGGGYDTDQDSAAYSADSVGNALYMIDAEDGSLLWSASDAGADLNLADMTNAIPSDVRVIDLTGDGRADRLYVADMGGRLFRFDVHNGNSLTGEDPFITGGRIASLGAGDLETPTTADNRRFYYAPDVSLVRSDSGDFMNIGLGSGYRAHPLNTETEDAFYAVWDPYTFDPPPLADENDPYSFDYGYGIVDKLLPAEGENSVTDLTDPDTPLPNGAVGWKIDLAGVGEKVLSEARTFQGQIFFNTYTPGVVNANPCAPAVGQARSYVVDLKGAAIGDERGTNLDQGTIPSEPVFVFPPPDDEGGNSDPGDNGGGDGGDGDDGDGDLDDEREDGEVACFIGPERCPVDLVNTPIRTYWLNDQD